MLRSRYLSSCTSSQSNSRLPGSSLSPYSHPPTAVTSKPHSKQQIGRDTHTQAKTWSASAYTSQRHVVAECPRYAQASERTGEGIDTTQRCPRERNADGPTTNTRGGRGRCWNRAGQSKARRAGSITRATPEARHGREGKGAQPEGNTQRDDDDCVDVDVSRSGGGRVQS